MGKDIYSSPIRKLAALVSLTPPPADRTVTAALTPDYSAVPGSELDSLPLHEIADRLIYACSFSSDRTSGDAAQQPSVRKPLVSK